MVVEGGVVAAKVAAAVDIGKEAVTMAVAMVAAEDTITTTAVVGMAADVAIMAEAAEVDATVTGITTIMPTGITVEMATGTMPIRMRVTKGRSMQQISTEIALIMEVRAIMQVLLEIMANMFIGPTRIMQKDLTMPIAVAMVTKVAKLVMLLAGVRTTEVCPNWTNMDVVKMCSMFYVEVHNCVCANFIQILSYPGQMMSAKPLSLAIVLKFWQKLSSHLGN